MLHYLRIWRACIRYSVTRQMMFRGDLLVWSLVELFWMAVNVMIVAVIYQHTSTVAGWSEYQMLLLVSTSMLIQRLLMAFFWGSLYDMSRNIRTGMFDFVLAQPGNPLFMCSTRKLESDGFLNSFVALGLVIYSVRHLGLHPSWGDMLLYASLILGGLLIHYSVLVMVMSLPFWLTSAQGVEGCYFTMTDVSRLPREAFRNTAQVLATWALPVVIVSNAPARVLLHGFQPQWTIGLFAFAAVWFAVAVLVFKRGLRRYASASS